MMNKHNSKYAGYGSYAIENEENGQGVSLGVLSRFKQGVSLGVLSRFKQSVTYCHICCV
jgi:hypothetical protein